MKLELLTIAFLLTSCIPPTYNTAQTQTQQPQYIQQQEQIVFPEGSRSYNGVRWIEIYSEREFWKQIYSAPNVIVLFSATWCEPCKIAKGYWENQSTLFNWKFIYWQARKETDIKSLSKIMSAFTYDTQPTLPLPYVSVIQNAKQGKPIKGPNGVLKINFSNLEGCTINLKKWLSSY